MCKDVLLDEMMLSGAKMLTTSLSVFELYTHRNTIIILSRSFSPTFIHSRLFSRICPCHFHFFLNFCVYISVVIILLSKLPKSDTVSGVTSLESNISVISRHADVIISFTPFQILSSKFRHK